MATALLPRSRKILLWIMLIALAIGAVSMLMDLFGDNAYDKLPASAIFTLITCGLMIAAARTVEKRRLREASIIAFCVVFVEYLLCLTALWGNNFSIFNADQRLWSLIAGVAIAGIPSIGLVRMLYYPTRRIAGVAGLALSALALVAMGIGAFTAGSSDEMRFWFCGMWLEAYALLLVANLVGMTKLMPVTSRWVGVAATIVAYGLLLWMLLADIEPTQW